MTLLYSDVQTKLTICTHCNRKYKTLRGMVKHFKRIYGGQIDYISVTTGLGKAGQ